jgi:hypothetical protein
MYDILGAVVEMLVHTVQHTPWGRQGCLIALVVVLLIRVAGLLLTSYKAIPQ